MAYLVKEIYYTLQGEGAQTGRAAVFCRFAGCNLWSGRAADRERAVCRFCDTDFVGADGPGGGQFGTAEELAEALRHQWVAGIAARAQAGVEPQTGGLRRDRPGSQPFVVCTGGEPLLQLDAAAVAALHARGFEIAIETNGTRIPPEGIDWVCVSPKAGAELVLREGDELKFVYPQTGLAPADLENLRFRHFFLQPMDGPERERNTRLAVEYCLAHPRWWLSLQTHKLLGIP